MSETIPQGVFDRKMYWEARLEAAQKAVEVARRNLAMLAMKDTDVIYELTKRAEEE